MTDIGDGTRDLDRDACWAHLRSADLGRLSVCVNGEPEIFPVNYVVDGGTLVFRTAPGTKLAVAKAWPAVAFEADGVDAGTREAWSVVVKGTAEQITGRNAEAAAAGLPLYPQHSAPKSRFVRIMPRELSGRRFPTAPRGTWARTLGTEGAG